MGRLAIKHHHQPQTLYCVPASVKMCLDYMCKKHKIKGLPTFSIHKIVEITKTNIYDGTPPRAIENLNQYLQKARPPLSFIYHEMSKFTEIEKELKSERPIIVFLNPKENHTFNDGSKLVHAVVAVEYDEDNHIMYYDDPDEDNETTAIQSLDVGTFISRWGIESRWVQITVGKNQTYLAGYTNEEDVMSE